MFFSSFPKGTELAVGHGYVCLNISPGVLSTVLFVHFAPFQGAL